MDKEAEHYAKTNRYTFQTAGLQHQNPVLPL